jgi:hypothetical protein
MTVMPWVRVKELKGKVKGWMWKMLQGKVCKAMIRLLAGSQIDLFVVLQGPV